MALNGFSVMLFVPAAPEVLAEAKRTIYAAFCLLILQFKLATTTLKIKFTMTYWLLHNIIFQIKKRNDCQARSHSCSKGEGRETAGQQPPIEMPSMIKKKNNEAFCVLNFFF